MCVGNKKEIEVEEQEEQKHLNALIMNFYQELKFMDEWLTKPKIDEHCT